MENVFLWKIVKKKRTKYSIIWGPREEDFGKKDSPQFTIFGFKFNVSKLVFEFVQDNPKIPTK